MIIEPAEQDLLWREVDEALFFRAVGSDSGKQVLLDDLPHQTEHEVRCSFEQVLAPDVDYAAP